MTRDEAIEYLKTVHKDEPVFVLRAQDKYATSTVASWAGIVGSVNASDGEEVKRKAHLKAKAALRLVDVMRAWQAKHTCKIPD